MSECQDYEVLKKALLLAYIRIPEYHRKRFRTLFKGSGESYCNFAFRLSLLFKSWLEGEQAFENLDRLKEAVKREQFTNCLLTELHRWVIEKHLKAVSEAARLADEYAMLYEPFKLKHTHKSMDFVQKTKAEYFPEQVFEKGKFFQNKNKARGNRNHQGCFHGFRSPMCCVICGKQGHFANFCHTQFPDMTKQIEPIEPVHLALHLDQKSRPLPYVSKIHERYVPYCASVTLCTTQGVRRPVVLRRCNYWLQGNPLTL